MWIRQFLGGVVSESCFALYEETFGSCGTMTLQSFSFGSAAEVLDDDAGEKRDGVEVGFGFGDCYDFAIVGSTCDLKCVCNEAALLDAAIEVDLLQLRGAKSGGSCVSDDHLIQATAGVAAVFRVAGPVVDGEERVRIVPVDVCEAEEHAIAACAEVDG